MKELNSFICSIEQLDLITRHSEAQYHFFTIDIIMSLCEYQCFQSQSQPMKQCFRRLLFSRITFFI